MFTSPAIQGSNKRIQASSPPPFSGAPVSQKYPPRFQNLENRATEAWKNQGCCDEIFCAFVQAKKYFEERSNHPVEDYSSGLQMQRGPVSTGGFCRYCSHDECEQMAADGLFVKVAEGNFLRKFQQTKKRDEAENCSTDETDELQAFRAVQHVERLGTSTDRLSCKLRRGGQATTKCLRHRVQGPAAAWNTNSDPSSQTLAAASPSKGILHVEAGFQRLFQPKCAYTKVAAIGQTNIPLQNETCTMEVARRNKLGPFSNHIFPASDEGTPNNLSSNCQTDTFFLYQANTKNKALVCVEYVAALLHYCTKRFGDAAQSSE